MKIRVTYDTGDKNIAGLLEFFRQNSIPVEIIADDPLDTLIEDCRKNNIPVHIEQDHTIPAWVPQELAKKMQEKGLTVKDVERVVVDRGYPFAGVSMRDYPPDFVQGCLIGAWDQLYDYGVKNALFDLPF